MKKHPCHTSCIALIPQILAIRRSAVRQPIGACEHAPRRNHNTVVRKFSSTVRGSDISCVENKGTNWVVHKPQFLASVLRGFLPSFRRRAAGSHGLVNEPVGSVRRLSRSIAIEFKLLVPKPCEKGDQIDANEPSIKFEHPIKLLRQRHAPRMSRMTHNLCRGCRQVQALFRLFCIRSCSSWFTDVFSSHDCVSSCWIAGLLLSSCPVASMYILSIS